MRNFIKVSRHWLGRSVFGSDIDTATGFCEAQGDRNETWELEARKIQGLRSFLATGYTANSGAALATDTLSQLKKKNIKIWKETYDKYRLRSRKLHRRKKKQTLEICFKKTMLTTKSVCWIWRHFPQIGSNEIITIFSSISCSWQAITKQTRAVLPVTTGESQWFCGISEMPIPLWCLRRFASDHSTLKWLQAGEAPVICHKDAWQTASGASS